MIEHLHYECAMLTFSLNVINTTKEQGLYNLGHECFHVHARNIINFITANSNVVCDPADAKILQLAEEQIFSLTSARTNVMGDKIQREDNNRMYNNIQEMVTDYITEINRENIRGIQCLEAFYHSYFSSHL
jgi:predicted secreted protein